MLSQQVNVTLSLRSDAVYQITQPSQFPSFLANFAKGYAEHGMLAYVAGVQRKEREAGVDVLQHQVCIQIVHPFKKGKRKVQKKFDLLLTMFCFVTTEMEWR
jgi:Isocitrate lyase family